MDHRSLDQIARKLATATSRRTGLSLLVGGALAALLARLGVAEVAGAPPGSCKKPGRKCDKRKGDRCCGAAKCKAKRCKCPGKRIACGRRCLTPLQLQSDPANCGTCGTICDAGQFCAEGTCVIGQGTCVAGADTCLGAVQRCNGQGDCFCVQTIEGTTRCGQPVPVGTIPCDGCASSDDCAELLPDVPGAFCVVDTAGVCNCDEGQSRCFTPCPD